MQNYDVLIVGGGIVGMATALQLARRTSFTICLFDKNPIDDFTPTKVSAISPGAEKALGDAWAAVKNKSAFEKMHIWDAEKKSSCQFDAADIHENELGCIVEDHELKKALYAECQAYENIFIYASVQMKKLDKRKTVILVSTDVVDVAVKMVIGADGANSWVRTTRGIEVETHAYPHMAITAIVQTELPHEKIARQCFYPQGPLAFLPMTDPHTCSIVWSTTPEHADQLMQLSEKAFIAELSQFDALGAVTGSNARTIFPLTMRHAKQYVEEAIALVGDAAHTIHPLAGQGVNLGLLDSKKLVDVICSARLQNRSFYGLANLRQYERYRKTENKAMLAVIDGLLCLFATDNKPLKLLRNAGMNAVNRTTFLKDFILRYALGGGEA
jgi:2-octaprenylphenol hydroxylase